MTNASGPSVSHSGNAEAATGGVANSSAIEVNVENNKREGAWRFLAYAAGAALLVLTWQVWRQPQAASTAESVAPLNPVPGAAASTHAGVPAATPPAVAPAPRAKAAKASKGSTASTAEKSVSSPSPTPRPVVRECADIRFALSAGMGVDLAACEAGSGGTFTDVMFTDEGLTVGDGISTRKAGDGGSSKYTSYETCRGPFRSTTHAQATVPITTAACLLSDRSVAYIDVVERDSTRLVVNLLAWKDRG
ncbi:hypothetical protein AB0M02_25170 [Actinoplanes sp. NPDC051861]|uniref:hypothetical protein n=1 Tax=Actinoplanes sp. NPDC051861 TaxID=3155170 RepID=UPI003432967E